MKSLDVTYGAKADYDGVCGMQCRRQRCFVAAILASRLKWVSIESLDWHTIAHDLTWYLFRDGTFMQRTKSPRTVFSVCLVSPLLQEPPAIIHIVLKQAWYRSQIFWHTYKVVYWLQPTMAPLAQWLAHQTSIQRHLPMTRNLGVASSSLARGCFCTFFFCVTTRSSSNPSSQHSSFHLRFR
jgi:hypothetical protein